MKSIRIECEIVTPLLMHGANSRKPELRAQSIKGVIRYWWRAIHNNLELDTLRKREAEIFGDTSQKSSFRIKIVKGTKLNIISTPGLPHRQKSFFIKGFAPDQTFFLEFIGSNIETATNIFLLASVLGGFGQRARRGFGSIKVTKIGDKNIDFIPTKENITRLISQINPDFTYETRQREHPYPYVKEIIVGDKKYKEYTHLLKKIGEATHQVPCFGRAKPRLASPVVVSILEIGNRYVPIITKLQGNGCWEKFENFKGLIL